VAATLRYPGAVPPAARHGRRAAKGPLAIKRELRYNRMEPNPGAFGANSAGRLLLSMGTSAAHRSPATPEWERVRDLYRQGVRDPGEISRRIAQALEPRTERDMSGPGVSACLDALIHGVHGVAQRPPRGPLADCSSLLGGAAALRLFAERRIACAGWASRFSDLALDALGLSVLQLPLPGAPGQSLADPALGYRAGLGTLGQEDRLPDLAESFLRDDIDRCFRYFVTRDISEFIGGDALPTVGEARLLTDDIAAHCRRIAAAVSLGEYNGRLRDAVADREASRLTLAGEVMAHALGTSLSLIREGHSVAQP